MLDVAGQSGGKQQAEFQKAMHFSPFLPLDLRYGWHSTAPGPHLAVHLDVFKGQSRLLDATLSLRRQPLGGRSMAGVDVYKRQTPDRAVPRPHPPELPGGVGAPCLLYTSRCV